MEDTITRLTKSPGPLTGQRLWDGGTTGQTEADQVAFVIIIIHETISAVKDGGIVDEVDVAGLGSEVELCGTRNSFDGLQSFHLLAAQSR